MRLLPALFLSFVIACSSELPDPAQTKEARTAGAVEEIESPAGKGAAHSFLSAASDGSILLSWLEPADTRHALKISRLREGAWSNPVTVVERDDLFVNWADFPSVIEAADGRLAAHWLQKSGSSTYAYDVWIAQSADGGQTWSAPFRLHDDTTQTEHGFVSMIAEPDSAAVAAVWLDGRHMSGGHDGHGGDMTLRFGRFGPDGHVSDGEVLDARTCECCATGMALSSEGPVVAYRDRSENEIRDISIVRRTAAGWTEPATLHPDGWEIAGCPVNGPQVDARGRDVAVAWFTAPEGNARVNVSFSNDGGATFGAPIRVDESTAEGRVDLVLLSDGSAWVTWIEGEDPAAALVGRKVGRDGILSPLVKVAATTSARKAGFPRMAQAADADLFITWVDARVRV
jgi:hypothetical protein